MSDLHNATVRGIFDAISAGVANALVNDKGFIDRLSSVISDLVVENIQHNIDFEKEFENFAESRVFERALQNSVEEAVHAAVDEQDFDKMISDALDEQTIEANSIDGLDEAIAEFITEHVTVSVNK
jgi:hypothetical protein